MRFILGLILLLLVLAISLSLPYFQTKVAQYFTNSINKDFGTNIAIGGVRISIFGGVKFKDVVILDHHKDTLIFSKIINTNVLEGKRILDGDLIFEDIKLEGLLFNLKTYKNEKETNMDFFINSFNSGKPANPNKHFLLKANSAVISNGHFILTDENKKYPVQVDFKRLNAALTDFLLYGPDVSTSINKMSFLDSRGLYVANLSSKFSYTKKNIRLENLFIQTKESKIKADVFLNYKIEDFAKFTDKVKFDVKLYPSLIASNDIRHFYDELGKNLFFRIKSDIKGPLNNLNFTNLNLQDSKNTKISGAINFKNILGNASQKFAMDADLTELFTSYDNLVSILPNVLGKKLPIEIKRLGAVDIVGTVKLTAQSIAAGLVMNSD
ncbi:MAG: hypothetical protein ACI87N_002691, partial [Flavobacteriales bacterium]